jgi:hypothetical protein
MVYSSCLKLARQPSLVLRKLSACPHEKNRPQFMVGPWFGYFPLHILYSARPLVDTVSI